MTNHDLVRVSHYLRSNSLRLQRARQDDRWRGSATGRLWSSTWPVYESLRQLTLQPARPIGFAEDGATEDDVFNMV